MSKKKDLVNAFRRLAPITLILTYVVKIMTLNNLLKKNLKKIMSHFCTTLSNLAR